jgi:hypothetical protein
MRFALTSPPSPSLSLSLSLSLSVSLFRFSFSLFSPGRRGGTSLFCPLASLARSCEINPRLWPINYRRFLVANRYLERNPAFGGLSVEDHLEITFDSLGQPRLSRGHADKCVRSRAITRAMTCFLVINRSANKRSAFAGWSRHRR